MIIGFIDSRPHWDDTGITVGMILVSSAFLGFVMPRRAWIWAIALGVWIPVWNILQHNNYSSLIALPVAIIGAYIGVIIYKVIFYSSD
ncbi:MAG: hypothetical protein P4L35_10540 [Ignavibacteriaceae bacterium]|nr:hypothetical protein [Ignavibacteriaceae bacterium]